MPNTENESNEREYYRYLQLKAKVSGAPTSEKPEMGWGEYIGRGVTDSLPVAGMAGGGLLGAAAGPGGTIGGGGLGYAAGQEAKGLLNHYVFGDDVPDTKPMEQVKRVSGNTAEGAQDTMLGLIGGPAIQKVKNLKRNIVITPVIDELSNFRKMLPETNGSDIDAFVSELKGINKYGKVNSSELDAIKDKINDVLQSQETGPYLRRAAVLAQDVASNVKGPAIDPFTKKPFNMRKP